MNSKYRLISLNIYRGSYSNFLKTIMEYVRTRESMYVCIANVHMLIEAYKDVAFQNIVNNATLVAPDGMPLAKGFEILYGGKQDRIAGMDLLPDLLKTAEKEELKVFFYGGTPKMLDQTLKYCKKVFPRLIMAGAISPPFRELNQEEVKEYIKEINCSEANLVFVALGCPKQEKWMAAMKGHINACMIGIGGALPVMVGMQKRAPRWMQQSSLEWLYRLVQEPSRLFKRYFYTNTLFLYLFSKEYFKTKLKHSNS